jgi:hypothetical protein
MTRKIRVSLEEDFLNDCTADLARKVAERAYYKAEKRGFAAGHETEDWLEAEAEIKEEEALAHLAPEE